MGFDVLNPRYQYTRSPPLENTENPADATNSFSSARTHISIAERELRRNTMAQRNTIGASTSGDRVNDTMEGEDPPSPLHRRRRQFNIPLHIQPPPNQTLDHFGGP